VALLWSLFTRLKVFMDGSFVAPRRTSLLLLALFYWLIDVKGYTKWAFPFKIIGMNSITIYVIQAIFDFGVVANIFIHGFYTHFGEFKDVFFVFCVVFIKWLFLYFLYKQKIFLKYKIHLNY
jgi:predicted acyltransferase